MWTQEFTDTSTADLTRLWRLLADVDGWAAWNAGIERIVLHGPVEVGATFDMTPPGEAPVRSTVVAVREPELLTDHTDIDGVSITVEHRLAARDESGTVVTFTITVSGDAPETTLCEIGQGVSADFPAVIAALIALAERRDPAPR